MKQVEITNTTGSNAFKLINAIYQSTNAQKSYFVFEQKSDELFVCKYFENIEIRITKTEGANYKVFLLNIIDLKAKTKVISRQIKIVKTTQISTGNVAPNNKYTLPRFENMLSMNGVNRNIAIEFSVDFKIANARPEKLKFLLKRSKLIIGTDLGLNTFEDVSLDERAEILFDIQNNYYDLWENDDFDITDNDFININLMKKV
ncbi:hypothetical protein [Soonwooa purpurea]